MTQTLKQVHAYPLGGNSITLQIIVKKKNKSILTFISLSIYFIALATLLNIAYFWQQILCKALHTRKNYAFILCVLELQEEAGGI